MLVHGQKQPVDALLAYEPRDRSDHVPFPPDTELAPERACLLRAAGGHDAIVDHSYFLATESFESRKRLDDCGGVDGNAIDPVAQRVPVFRIARRVRLEADPRNNTRNPRHACAEGREKDLLPRSDEKGIGRETIDLAPQPHRVMKRDVAADSTSLRPQTSRARVLDHQVIVAEKHDVVTPVTKSAEQHHRSTLGATPDPCAIMCDDPHQVTG